MRRITILSRVLLLTLLPLVAWQWPSTTLAQTQAQPPDGWVSLGPNMPIEMYGLGVSSAWPDDPFVIARTRNIYKYATERQVEPIAPMVRTTDGGRTWEPLPDAPPYERLIVMRTETPQRIIFALPAPDVGPKTGREPPRQLLRSIDDGAAWTAVLSDITSEPRMVTSPSFAQDGNAYLLESGALFETTDFGAHWTKHAPLYGHIVQAIAYSPGFAVDRTLVAAVSSTELDADDGDSQGTAPQERAGVLVSRDEGQTWTSASEGHQIDGAPYRDVRSLAVSPDFAHDQTLFAFAWGPLERFADGSAKWQHTAVFMSQDAGGSWQAIWKPEYRPQPLPGSYIPKFSVTVLPSPQFAERGRVALAVYSATVSPTSGGCRLVLSDDRGTNWAPMTQVQGVPSCTGAALLPRDPPTVVYSSSRNHGSSSLGVYASTPNRVFYLLSPPLLLPGADRDGPTVARDGTIFVGTAQGVWMLPPDATLPKSTP